MTKIIYALVDANDRVVMEFPSLESLDGYIERHLTTFGKKPYCRKAKITTTIETEILE